MTSRSDEDLYFIFAAACTIPDCCELKPNIPLPAIPPTKPYIEIISTEKFVTLHLSRLSSPKYRATALAALEGIIEIMKNESGTT